MRMFRSTQSLHDYAGQGRERPDVIGGCPFRPMVGDVVLDADLVPLRDAPRVRRSSGANLTGRIVKRTGVGQPTQDASTAERSHGTHCWSE